jgi:hypothetical protein
MPVDYCEKGNFLLITVREAAQKFSQSFRDWNDARNGTAPLKASRAKIELLEK